MTSPKSLARLCALLLAATVAGTTLVAQSNLDFTLLNKTGLTISELYLSSAHSTDWEEDVLGRDVLKNGESVEFGQALFRIEMA